MTSCQLHARMHCKLLLMAASRVARVSYKAIIRYVPLNSNHLAPVEVAFEKGRSGPILFLLRLAAR